MVTAQCECNHQVGGSDGRPTIAPAHVIYWRGCVRVYPLGDRDAHTIEECLKYLFTFS